MGFKIAKTVWHGLKIIKNAALDETLLLQRLQAKNYLTEIPEETWNKISQSVFKQPNDSKSIFLDHLGQFKEYFDSRNIGLPKNVDAAFQNLEHKATVFAYRMDVSLSKGNTPLNV